MLVMRCLDKVNFQVPFSPVRGECKFDSRERRRIRRGEYLNEEEEQETVRDWVPAFAFAYP